MLLRDETILSSAEGHRAHLQAATPAPSTTSLSLPVFSRPQDFFLRLLSSSQALSLFLPFQISGFLPVSPLQIFLSSSLSRSQAFSLPHLSRSFSLPLFSSNFKLTELSSRHFFKCKDSSLPLLSNLGFPLLYGSHSQITSFNKNNYAHSQIYKRYFRDKINLGRPPSF